MASRAQRILQNSQRINAEKKRKDDYDKVAKWLNRDVEPESVNLEPRRSSRKHTEPKWQQNFNTSSKPTRKTVSIIYYCTMTTMTIDKHSE
jgi:hypothetical protein